MNANARKLMKALGIDYAAAVLLVKAGLTTENRVKNTTNTKLLKIVDRDTVAKIRGQ